MKNKVLLMIIIPAYNEASSIGDVIRKIPRRINGISKVEIVVIDDGSIDQTAVVSVKKGVTVISHMVNCGLGAAIATGFAYAKKRRAKILVTLDADGQHNPKDLSRLIKSIIEKKADVVIGSRLIRNSRKMPISRRFVNYLANIFTFLLTKVWSSDSQSGYRAFSEKALKYITLITQRMEVSSEVFREINRHNLRYKEIVIKPVYTKYSLRKGQSILNAPNILYKLLIRIARR